MTTQRTEQQITYVQKESFPRYFLEWVSNNGYIAMIGVAFGTLVLASTGSGIHSWYKDSKNFEIQKALIEKGIYAQTKNVRGNKESEEFIELNGKKYYASVDGKSIEEVLDTTQK